MKANSTMCPAELLTTGHSLRSLKLPCLWGFWSSVIYLMIIYKEKTVTILVSPATWSWQSSTNLISWPCCLLWLIILMHCYGIRQSSARWPLVRCSLVALRFVWLELWNYVSRNKSWVSYGCSTSKEKRKGIWWFLQWKSLPCFTNEKRKEILFHYLHIGKGLETLNQSSFIFVKQSSRNTGLLS